MAAQERYSGIKWKLYYCSSETRQSLSCESPWSLGKGHLPEPGPGWKEAIGSSTNTKMCPVAKLMNFKKVCQNTTIDITVIQKCFHWPLQGSVYFSLSKCCIHFMESNMEIYSPNRNIATIRPKDDTSWHLLQHKTLFWKHTFLPIYIYDHT